MNYIRQSLPGLQCSGENYPVGAVKQMLGSAFSMFFMISLALAFGLGKFFLTEEIATIVEQNKTGVVVAGFMFNMIGSSLLQSGAFEVYLDGRLIFSKLEAGGVPDPQQLLELVKMSLASA